MENYVVARLQATPGIQRDGTNWVDLPIGTLGQHLTITATGPGGALIPAWGA